MAMQNIKIKIIEVKASIEKSHYSRSKDLNGVHSEPKEYILDIKAEYNDLIAYFTHRFKFSSLIGEFGSLISPDKEESDFVEFIEGETSHHMGGHQGDKPYQNTRGEFKPKIFPESEIMVRCQVEEKISQKGNKYYQLKRVKLPKESK